MTMIKGKTTSDKDIVPNVVNIGEPAFIRQGDQWIINDGSQKPIKLETKSLSDVLKSLNLNLKTKSHA